MIKIKKRWSDTVVFTSQEATTFSEAVKEALKLKVDLRGSNLRGSNLSDSNLRGSNLRDSDLSGSNLRGSNLSDSNLRGSNLSGSDLSGSNLSDSDLRGSNLRGSNLSGSDLSGSNLSGSDLSGSNLSGSNLSGSNLSGSNLRGSNLSGSDLSGSNLSGSNLSGIRKDFWDVLLRAKHEIAGLREALILGKVEGKVYEGECCCLLGTLAHVKCVNYKELDNDLRPDSSRPIERFFLGISKGSTPENNQLSKLAVEWLDEFVILLNK